MLVITNRLHISNSNCYISMSDFANVCGCNDKYANAESINKYSCTYSTRVIYIVHYF